MRRDEPVGLESPCATHAMPATRRSPTLPTNLAAVAHRGSTHAARERSAMPTPACRSRASRRSSAPSSGCSRPTRASTGRRMSDRADAPSTTRSQHCVCCHQDPYRSTSGGSLDAWWTDFASWPDALMATQPHEHGLAADSELAAELGSGPTASSASHCPPRENEPGALIRACPVTRYATRTECTLLRRCSTNAVVRPVPGHALRTVRSSNNNLPGDLFNPYPE
jgi:hypothetical protein